MPAQQEKGMMSIAGGALILVSGILGIIWWGLIIAAGAATFSFMPMFGAELANIVFVCGAIGVIFSLIAILGGVMGIMRKMWGISLVGGIFGLLAIGYFLGSLLALVGIILIAISKKDFQ